MVKKFKITIASAAESFPTSVTQHQKLKTNSYWDLLDQLLRKNHFRSNQNA